MNKLLFLIGFVSCAALISAFALQREANTTIDVPLEPQSGDYGLSNAFGSISFDWPVGMVTPPGETNRLFVIERLGTISVITNLAAPNKTVFLDITDRVEQSGYKYNEQGLLGLAFHPDYATNGYFYVFYTGNATTTAGSGRHDILARFEVDSLNSNLGNPVSEQRILLQFDQAANHNGGALEFGPDGYLYVSLGDEGGGNDQYNNGQKIDQDFFAGILRIDVDQRPESLAPNPHPAVTANYSVPPDNPFIGITNFNGSAVNTNDVRTEFWAVGLRNPWRMSFDADSGLLYAGDVGQAAWEELILVEKGANYGWAYQEGFENGPKSGSAPTGFLDDPPLLAYPRGQNLYQGRAIVGGHVYRGSTLPELYGAYIFGDFGQSYSTDDDSKIWMLRHEGTNVTEWVLLDRMTGLGSFGIDPRNGDMLALSVEDENGDSIIQRLVRTSVTGDPPPALLSETGVFSDLTALTPNAGIVPYEINLPFWSDNAEKTRWFSVPDTNQTMTFSANGNWTFPTGTVWVKHFELEMTNGVPESKKRLETRLLVKNDSGVHGFTYRWGDSMTDAELVGETGLDETFYIEQGGSIVTQDWHYPARSECMACHTEAGGFALGFNTPQMNRDLQIQTLENAGYFSNTVSNDHLLPAMADLADGSISLEHRVRSYLAANCVYCHTPGSSPGLWDARFLTRTAEAGIIDGELVNDFGDPLNRVVSPGLLEKSMALQRISTRGSQQMPPLATSLIDTQAVALLSAWIAEIDPTYFSYAQWTNANAMPLGNPDDDFDSDGDDNYFEFLNRTDPTLDSSHWKIAAETHGTNVYVTFPQAAGRGYEIQEADNLIAPDWQPVNDPSNTPSFLAAFTTSAIPLETGGASNRFYRVRVFER